MVFNVKKEYKEFYPTNVEPRIVQVPKLNFLAVRGQGDSNEAGGEYQESIRLLYPIAYTIKMSKNTDYCMEGYFDFVVPPLEALWWQEGED